MKAILLAVIVLFPLVAAASPGSGWMEPQLGTFDPAVLQLIRAQAGAEGATGTHLRTENTGQMARDSAEYAERRAAAGPQRGGTYDDDAAHYARGNTLIMHVFINHGGGTWSAAERDLAGAKAFEAKDYYVNGTFSSGVANVHFDNEGTTAYWYINPTVPYTITSDSAFVGVIMDEVLMFAGVDDADGDGARRDDYTLGLQFWNGGWDNVIAVFQPADLTGRAWASYHYSVTAQYTDDSSNTWRHEWGHSFGACDEYIEDGQCNSGIDCGSCQSTYLDQVYNNGNCQLCNNDSCVMDNNVENTCWWTRHLWGREDDDSNGQLNWVKRRVPPTTFVDIFEMWNNGTFAHWTTSAGFAAHVRNPTWAVFGLRSPAAADYDLSLFLDNNHTYQMAASGYANPTVDFIVGDYNVNRLGNEHFEVDRFSGNASLYTLSWFNGQEELYSDGVVRPQNWVNGNVVRVYDVPLFGGETLAAVLDVTSGSGDFGMAMYRSVGTTYFSNRSGALWTSDISGAGGTEFKTFTVPADDVYGLVVWSNQDTNGTFTLQIGPASLTLVEEVPRQSSLDLRLYQYLVTDPYWSVVASRPATGQDITTRLFDDVQYQTHQGTSDDYSGVEFVTQDNISTGWDHVRVIEESGSGLHTTEWEAGADISTGYVTGSWTDTHVAKVWDVYLQNGQTYFFREYHPIFPAPRLNTGLFLMDRNGSDRVREKINAVAASDSHSSLDGGEWFQYLATRTGFHGLVLTMNNAGSDSYSIWHGRRVYPTPGDSITVSSEIVFGSTYGISNQWAVWGARPPTGGTADVVLFGQDSFTGTLGASLSVPGANFVAVDYHHTPIGNVYQRYRRTSGTGPLDIFYDAGFDDLPFTPGTPQAVQVPWGAQEVVQAFDVWVDGSGAPQDLKILLEDLSGNMDLGIALLQSNGAPYYGGKDDAAVVADAAGAGGSELLQYTATTADWFGIVVFNNTDSSGDYRLTLSDGQAVSSPVVVALPSEVSLAPRNSPFRSSTSLAVALPAGGPVRLTVYDIQGRLVRMLADRVLSAGSHTIAWDGRDGSGRSVGAGVYLVRLEANRTHRTTKLVRVP